MTAAYVLLFILAELFFTMSWPLEFRGAWAKALGAGKA